MTNDHLVTKKYLNKTYIKNKIRSPETSREEALLLTKQYFIHTTLEGVKEFLEKHKKARFKELQAKVNHNTQRIKDIELQLSTS